MKKLISIGLVLVLAGGLVLAENKRAEALDPASAVLIGASIMLLPILGHISHEHEYYGHAPYYPDAYPAARYDGGYYGNPYPTPTRVYYSAPRQAYYGGSRYERYYDRNWNRGYGYERDGGRHRGRYEDRRVRDYDRDRYARRY